MTARTLTLTALALGLTLAITGCNEDDRIEDLFEPGDTAALTVDNRLITFDRARPDIIATDVPVTGLGTGETLIGIDYRTRNGLLYGLTRNAVYQLSLRGVASNRRALSTPLTGTDFGVDFNPVADLLRVISNGNTSQVVNADTGAVTSSPASAGPAASSGPTTRVRSARSGSKVNSVVLIGQCSPVIGVVRPTR